MTCGNCAGHGSVPTSQAQATVSNGGEEACTYCSGTGKVMCTACLVSLPTRSCVDVQLVASLYVSSGKDIALEFVCNELLFCTNIWARHCTVHPVLSIWVRFKTTLIAPVLSGTQLWHERCRAHVNDYVCHVAVWTHVVCTFDARVLVCIALSLSAEAWG